MSLENLFIIEERNFLLENDITPITYRQCRKSEYIIGSKIINIKANKFSLQVPNDELVNEMEMLVNNICFDINCMIIIKNE